MKKLNILLFVLFLVSSPALGQVLGVKMLPSGETFTKTTPRAEGCDVIILKNGEEISAQVSEVGLTEIKYRKCDNTTGPSYTILKSDVFMVKYANGSKDVFDKYEKKSSDKVKTEGFSIASAATGITGILVAATFGTPVILLSMAAVVFGVIGYIRIKRSNGKLKGKGWAITGIASGIFLVILFIALIVFLLSYWH